MTAGKMRTPLNAPLTRRGMFHEHTSQGGRRCMVAFIGREKWVAFPQAGGRWELFSQPLDAKPNDPAPRMLAPSIEPEGPLPFVSGLAPDRWGR